MKLHLAALALTFTCLSLSAEAAIEIGDAVTFGRGPGTVGGVFYVDDINDGPGVDFHTFCVEITEHIQLGSKKYYVYDISNKNHLNNGQGQLTLGSFAAWLYTQYRDTTSPNHIPIGPAEHNKANAMQLGIWLSMGYDINAIDPLVNWNLLWLANTYINAPNGWYADFLADADWQKYGPNYTGGVQIMNLSTKLDANLMPLPGTYAQDQLIWTPAPEPGALLVWAGLIGVAAATVVYKNRPAPHIAV